MWKSLSLAAALAAAGAAQADPLGLGRPATPDEVAAWDIDVRPDGQGLPEGRGTVAEGEALYDDRCAACHGDFGEGPGRSPAVAGGRGTLTTMDPIKTVGSFWPHLSGVFDYVRRTMPYGEAQSLTADEVYAVTAYMLYLNDLVPEDFTLSRDNLATIRLPNEDGFVPDDRLETEIGRARDACMTDCRERLEITSRAGALGVTPEPPE